MAQLKEATREQHDEMEAAVDVMNQMFSLDDYKHLLQKFCRFYSAIEQKLAATDLRRFGLDLDERRKSGLLVNDLKSLGVDAECVTWTDLPRIDTPAQAFGCLYVLEGATLGGQVITRHLKTHLGILPENGGSFFNSYGSKVGPMWRAFSETITKFAEQNNEDGSIIEAAKSTFDSFRRCMVDKSGAVS